MGEEADCWSQDDDEITAQYQTLRRIQDKDTISQMSVESTDSREPIFIAAAEIRRRLSQLVDGPRYRTGFKRDPEDPSASVLKVKLAKVCVSFIINVALRICTFLCK